MHLTQHIAILLSIHQYPLLGFEILPSRKINQGGFRGENDWIDSLETGKIMGPESRCTRTENVLGQLLGFMSAIPASHTGEFLATQTS